MEVLRFESALPEPCERPDPPVRLHLAAGLLHATQIALREGSEGARESTVLWAGRSIESGGGISHLLVPRFVSRRDFLTIPRDERIEIASYLRRENLLAFADLHTHPHRAFLSDADRARPFSVRDGFYAIVIPDFAAGADGDGWRFYEARVGEWDEVAARDRVHAWPL